MALDDVESGRSPWGLLFWVALMIGAEDPALIRRWKELVRSRAPDAAARGAIFAIALVFAELAGHGREWRRELEDVDMTESAIVNEWMARGSLVKARQTLLKLLRQRHPGAVPPEVVRVIEQQDSAVVLDDWFDAALACRSLEEFLAILKR